MTINQDLITTVIATAGNTIPFATFEGEREVTLNPTQLGGHVHGIKGIGGSFAGTSGSITVLESGGGVVENTDPSPGNLPHNNMQPTIYLFLFVKL
jgi:microcystin-dependent protein